MCDICNAAGYEIEPACPKCGREAIGVYLDGSGCWECAPRSGELDAETTARVIAAFDLPSNRAERRAAGRFKR